MPVWEPLSIDNDLESGKPNVPYRIDRASPIELFQLFFTDKWLRIITERTNTNTKRIIDKLDKNDYCRPQAWHPVDRFDIMRYLAAVIYMGLYPYKDRGVQHYIYKFISLEY